MAADLDQLRARSKAARTVSVQASGATFTLCLPTRTAARAAWLKHRGPAGPVLAERELLEQSIVGWEGVTVGMALGTTEADAADPIAWDALAVIMLLDDRPDIEAVLGEAMTDAAQRRYSAIEEAEKNSLSVSNGTAAGISEQG